ncbi:MAG: dihydrolipoamide acetyltransferase family protein [Tuberibacillus sp.]
MVEVKLHDIGEGMTEGEVIHLFVKEGDEVKIDQPLVEVQTDKMTAELPSPAAGKVQKVLVQIGDVIEVGTTMILIGADNVDASHEAAPTLESVMEMDAPQETEDKPLIVPKGPVRILAAPHTRKLAREVNVNLEDVKGSGRLGRITDEDVLAHANGMDQKESMQQTKAIPEEIYDYEEIPFKGRRKTIADRMVHSLFTIPHVTHFDEADVTNLLDIKSMLMKLETKKGKTYNVSMAAFFIKAIAIALKDFPIFNARLDEEKGIIRLEKAVHIGLATDTDEGLIVPVIKHAESKSIIDIHFEMKELIQKAKENRLRHHDLTGSTFTISNVGPLGSTGATPIINYPEVALMAFHKTKKMPMVDEHDHIVVRSVMNISMSFDHRVADGAKAVSFTNKVIEYLENPEIMLLELK